MRTTQRHITRMLGTLAMASMLFLSACTDAVFDAPGNFDQPAASHASKLTHGHLMDQGLVTSYGKSDGTYQALVVVDRYQVIDRYDDGVVDRYGDDECSHVVDRYDDGIVDRYQVVERYANVYGAEITAVYSATMGGFSVLVPVDSLSAFTALLDADEDILSYEPDVPVQKIQDQETTLIDGLTQVLPWGITYVNATGYAGNVDADIYILDGGVDNNDLNIVSRKNFVRGDSGCGDDPVGHGTHVAGSAAAINNDFGVVGVAPGARIHDLTVLNSSGNSSLSTIITAVEYLTRTKRANPELRMVANMSFGSKVNTSKYNSLDNAIARSSQQGVVYVVAAGNSGENASLYSPAHVVEAITVGAHNALGMFASFSNRGSIVDILAPGVSIVSLRQGSSTLATLSGTSMAAPHVAGAAARYLAANPTASPSDVRNALVAGARRNILLTPLGTTNRSLYINGF